MSTVAQDQRSAIAGLTRAWRGKLDEATAIKSQLEDELALFVGHLVRISFTQVYGMPWIESRQLGAQEWKNLSDDFRRSPIVGFVKGYELDDQGHTYLIIARLGSTQELRVDVEDFDHFDIEILELAPE